MNGKDKLMKIKLRTNQIGLIIASAALLISIINMVIDSFSWSSIIMALCVLVVFFSNLFLFLGYNKNNGGSK